MSHRIKNCTEGPLLSGMVSSYKLKAFTSFKSAKLPLHPRLRSVYSEFPPGNLCTGNPSPQGLCLRRKQQVNALLTHPINLGTLGVLLQQAENSPGAEAVQKLPGQKWLDGAGVSRPPELKGIRFLCSLGMAEQPVAQHHGSLQIAWARNQKRAAW